MSIILVRHGETPLNVARVLQPPSTGLSERGAAQARAVARRLAERKPAGILSSDLPRAALTAQAISQASGVAVESTELLHERNFGDLRGKPYDALGYDAITMEDAPPGGESMPVFHARVDRALELITRMRAGLAGDLIVVTHGLVIRSLLNRRLRLPDGVPPPERIGNTSITVVTPDEFFLVSLLDCVVHLDAETGEDGRSLSGG